MKKENEEPSWVEKELIMFERKFREDVIESIINGSPTCISRSELSWVIKMRKSMEERNDEKFMSTDDNARLQTSWEKAYDKHLESTYKMLKRNENL